MVISTVHLSQLRLDRGFTLLEALLTMTILGVLLSIAVPDLQQLRIQRQGSLALQRLANSIYLARSAAATTGDIAVLCPSADGIFCGGLWHQGILVYLDGNDNQTPDPQEKLVARLQYENLPGKITWRAFQSKPFLQITPVGFTRYQNGNFTWCDAERNPSSAQQLILNRTGRVRYARDTNGDGLREGANGQPISCPQ
jgi:type IV fimbrial biogenesis protein FimT